MDAMRSVSQALRVLGKTPGFTLVAVLVLGLGIGANSAIFSIVNALLFRPLLIERPEELVGVFSRSTERPDTYRAFSYPNYVDLRDANSVFSSLTAHNLALVGLTRDGMTRRVFAETVASNFFETFGVSLFRGRSFTAEEELPGAASRSVIVGYSFWQKEGADPDLVGKTIDVNGARYTVVGIAPEGFTAAMALVSIDLWFPLGVHAEIANDFMGSADRSIQDRDNHAFVLIGRLRSGVAPQQADAELATLAARLEAAHPEANRHQTFVSSSLPRLSISTEPSDDSEIEAIALLLSGTAAAVLLIACLNLASLMLARGTARRKEIAIRLAIGGGRAPVVRQLLLEGFLLSLTGGVVGLLLAQWGNRLLVGSLIEILPLELVVRTTPDARVLLVSLAFCAASTLLFSLVPAWKLTRPEIVTDLKENPAEGGGGGVGSFRNVLVIGQVSLSLALLTAAGLFLRGAIEAANTDPGFELERKIVFEVDPSLVGYDENRGREIYRELGERIAALPGVASASLAATIPYGMVSQSERVLPAEAAPSGMGDEERGEEPISARFNITGAEFFSTLDVPLLRGRDFTPAEMLPGAPPVAIIDAGLAERLWPERDALGERIVFVDRDGRRESEEMEVVGIAPVLQDDFFDTDPEHVYVPLGQRYQGSMHYYVTASVASDEALFRLLEALRRELRAADAQLPVLSLQTMSQHLEGSASLWMIRAASRIFLVFGAVALTLAVVGVYGLRAYSVAQRTREMGIRMALGSSGTQALWLVLAEGLRLTAVGAGLGFLLALAIARALGSFLYEVDAYDPAVFALAPSVLIVASVFACLVPARRASRINPLVALKYD